MRWAFWRRARDERPSTLSAATWPPPAPPPLGGTGSTVRPSSADEPEVRRPTPAFSGAEPRPGEDVDDGPLPVDPGWADAVEAGGPGLASVRSDVVALVRAAAAADGAAADQVVQALADRDDDGLVVAVLAMLGVLGERLVAAAGYALDVGPEAGPEVVAQGGTVARRAEPLLRAVAPAASPDLVQLAVRCGAGVLEQDPVVGHLVDQPLEELARVAAVLLAQTVADGEGSVEELAEELAELLPG